MKELTIEQKAKAYDEAIKKLRSLHNNYYTVSTLIDVKEELENIFPELAESKDERIKKGLIAIITNFESLYLQENYSLSKEEALAWLEKLGQIKSPISQHENKMCLISKDERIRAQLIEFFSGYNTDEEWWGSITEKDILAWLEKQGEPKEINPSEFDSQLNRLLGQFKSLPKEELASSLSFYLNVVQNDGTYKSDEKQGEQKHQYISRPKYIGEEELLGEQKPTEWSEEDEEISEAIIKRIKGESEALSVSLSSAISWVGNIKDRVQLQSQWKPSDEQMTALRRVKNAVGGEGEIYGPLNSLYEDLKKLKD